MPPSRKFSRNSAASVVVTLLFAGAGCGERADVSTSSPNAVEATSGVVRMPINMPSDIASTLPTEIAPAPTLPPGLSPQQLDYEWKIWNQICDGCRGVTLDEAAKLLGEPIRIPNGLPTADDVEAWPVPGLNVTLKWKKTKFGSLAITFEQPPPYANASTDDLKQQVLDIADARANGSYTYGTPAIVEVGTRSLLFTISESGSGAYAKTRGGGIVVEVMGSNVVGDAARKEFMSFVADLASSYGEQPAS